MYTDSQRITMLKYILHVYEESTLQLSFSAFKEKKLDEAKEFGMQARIYKDTLALLTDDTELENIFSMAQHIGNILGDKISYMINKIKEYDEDGEDDV